MSERPNQDSTKVRLDPLEIGILAATLVFGTVGFVRTVVHDLHNDQEAAINDHIKASNIDSGSDDSDSSDQ